MLVVAFIESIKIILSLGECSCVVRTRLCK